MGWHVVTTGIPTSKIRFTSTPTVDPQTFTYAAGPASAGAIIDTVESQFGGNTTVVGGPHELTVMPQPATQTLAGAPPLETQPGAHAPCVVANQHLYTPPSNSVITPRVRPPKYVTPPVITTGTPVAPILARGGRPRGSFVPSGVTTAAPQVVTRWDTYGATSNGNL